MQTGGSRDTYLLNVLHNVQSFVANNGRIAWPTAQPLPSLNGSDATEMLAQLPEPGIAIENGTARLWFGNRFHPDLELQPLALDQTRS